MTNPIQTTKMNIKEKIKEIFFDYHIRGCGLADDKTNIICTDRKESDIKELLVLILQAQKEEREKTLEELIAIWKPREPLETYTTNVILLELETGLRLLKEEK